MAAVKFVNAMNHETILNLDVITAIEKPSGQKTLMVTVGKDHFHITLRTAEEREELFERISKVFEVE